MRKASILLLIAGLFGSAPLVAMALTAVKAAMLAQKRGRRESASE